MRLTWPRKAFQNNEMRGDGFFVPAHPNVHKGERNLIGALFEARRDFLGVWTDQDFKCGIRSARLFGRQIVGINAPEAIRHVLVTRHDNYERKSPQMRRALEFLLGDGLFISDGETWRTRRPLVADIVHKNRVPSFGPVMERAAGEMATRWASVGKDQTVNIHVEMAALTAEIISRSVFGNDLAVGEAERLTSGFHSYQSLIDPVNLGYFAGFDEGLPMLRGPRLTNAIRRVHSVINRVVGSHLGGQSNSPSMIELLVRRQAKSPELRLDVVALRNEAATIFMAGYETTAAVLTWTWYLLANAAWAEAAVHAEIQAVCGDRSPTIEDVPKLDYCRAVIEEAMRLYPPVPILGRQAKAEDHVDGTRIAASALVLVVPWLLHRSPDLWEKPDHFMPERFLRAERPMPFSYIPFAVGQRICPGLNFGLSEAILCLATLARRFRVRLVPGHIVEPQSRLTLRPRHGLLARIEPR